MKEWIVNAPKPLREGCMRFWSDFCFCFCCFFVFLFFFLFFVFYSLFFVLCFVFLLSTKTVEGGGSLCDFEVIFVFFFFYLNK